MNFWTIYLVIGLLVGALFVLRANHVGFDKMITAIVIVILLWPVWLALTVFWTIKYYIEALKG
jgi:hypothetical protein